MVVGRRKSEFGDLDEVSVVQVKEGDDGDRVVRVRCREPEEPDEEMRRDSEFRWIKQ